MSDLQRNAIILGITGGIACGKSEVGRILEEMGFGVCDADHVAHRLMQAGTPVFKQVVDHFGGRVLAEDGEICRPVLGEIVFENPTELQKLNRMVHPAVRAWISGWIKEQREKMQNAAIQLPLLYESGMEELDWDVVFCVSSTESLALQRLQSRGIKTEDAWRRIKSQMPLAEKEKRADVVLRNTGSLEELNIATQQAVKAVWVER